MSSCRMVPLCALLALVSALGAIAAPPSCKSFYEVLKATPSLSNLYKTVSLVPEMKKLLSNKNAKWTFIAPTNKAIKKPSSKLDEAQVVDLLKQHIVKGVYANGAARFRAANKALARLAGGPLTPRVAYKENFDDFFGSYYFVNLTLPNGKPSGVYFVFIEYPEIIEGKSLQPEPGKLGADKTPAIPTCQGVLYPSDKAFPYVKTVKG